MVSNFGGSRTRPEPWEPTPGGIESAEAVPSSSRSSRPACWSWPSFLVTGRAAVPGFAGLVIGLVSIVIHLVGVPLDGTSVNPARSLGPALFAGGDALAQVWLFVVAPSLGAAIAALLAPIFDLPSDNQAAQAPGTDPTGAHVPS